MTTTTEAAATNAATTFSKRRKTVRLDEFLPQWREFAEEYQWCGSAESHLMRHLGLRFEHSGSGARFVPRAQAPGRKPVKTVPVTAFREMVEGMEGWRSTPGVPQAIAWFRERFAALWPPAPPAEQLSRPESVTFTITLSPRAWLDGDNMRVNSKGDVVFVEGDHPVTGDRDRRIMAAYSIYHALRLGRATWTARAND